MQAEDMAELIIAQLKLNRRVFIKTVVFGLRILKVVEKVKSLKVDWTISTIKPLRLRKLSVKLNELNPLMVLIFCLYDLYV
jgi:SPX domain protein involved in polyphosphate accumulation